MIVLSLCNKLKIKIPKVLNRLGEGADGEVFQLPDLDKVIKLSVLYDNENSVEKFDNQFSNIENHILNIMDLNPEPFAKIYDYKYLGNFERDHYTKNKQSYVLYYYVLEKLFKISNDEKEVLSRILFKPNKDFDYSNLYSHNKAIRILNKINLDFNKEEILKFYSNIKKSPIIHSDIHLSNIMKNKDGQFKLIDFDRC